MTSAESEALAVDVLVVGAGPAGLATAIALRMHGGLEVAVLDRCGAAASVGETLAPGTRGLLEALGVWSDFEAQGHLPAYGTSAAWGQPEPAKRDFVMMPFGCGWHLDRARFDALLARRAETLGVVRLQAGLRGIARSADGWRVHDTGMPTRTHTARFVVDASGRSSCLARRVGARLHFLDRQVAALGEFALPDDAAMDQLTLVEAFEGGWSYSVRIPGDRLMVAILGDGDAARTAGLFTDAGWATSLEALPYTRRRLSGSRRRGALRRVAAHSARLDRCMGDGWLAVGDAAASHDPLSGSGIPRALDGGLRAARAIRRSLLADDRAALDEYAHNHATDYARYMHTHAQYYAIEQRWPTQPFWRRRQRRIELHPLQRLQHVKDHRLPVPPAFLLDLDLHALLGSASRPRPAHELVAEVARDPADNLQIVLGLQWLLEIGALRVVDQD